MKFLFLFLLLTSACIKQDKPKITVSAISNTEIKSLEQIKEEMGEDYDPDVYIEQFFDPETGFPYEKPVFTNGEIPYEYRLPKLEDEIYALRHQKVTETPELLSRLIRVEDNFKSFSNSSTGLRVYTEILWDPSNHQYYSALFFLPQERTDAQEPYVPGKSKPYTTTRRPIYLSNNSEGQQVYKDGDSDLIYTRRLVALPDYYKGYVEKGKYIYDDPSNSLKVVLKPFTNKGGETNVFAGKDVPPLFNSGGEVYYKGLHPVSGQMMSATRYLNAGGQHDFDESINRSGEINLPDYTNARFP